MIQLVYCVRRKSDVSPTALRKYWLEQHGPLVKRHAAAMCARRYVQSHTLETEAGLRAASALLEDERRFVDFAASSLFMTEEHTIF